MLEQISNIFCRAMTMAQQVHEGNGDNKNQRCCVPMEEGPPDIEPVSIPVLRVVAAHTLREAKYSSETAKSTTMQWNKFKYRQEGPTTFSQVRNSLHVLQSPTTRSTIHVVAAAWKNYPKPMS